MELFCRKLSRKDTTVTEVEQSPVWISWKDWRFSRVMPLAATELALCQRVNVSTVWSDLVFFCQVPSKRSLGPTLPLCPFTPKRA